jgi:hypothetical protein
MISRQEAKAQGLKRYFTGLACKHGHVGERLVSNGACLVCVSEKENRPYYKARKAANARKPARKEQQIAYRQTQAAREKQAMYRQTSERRAAQLARKQTPDYKKKAAATYAVWSAANKERIAANGAAWRKENTAARTSYQAQRKATQLKATPAWVDRQAIKAIYEQANFTSRVTGEPMHVDHIYPLQSDWVCGLHVPLNLQILTATENVKKSNKLLDDPFLQ